jgi:hypothetical protein
MDPTTPTPEATATAVGDDNPVGVHLALRSAARNYRRALLIAVTLGAVSLIALTIVGQYLAGILLCVGLGLGAYNSKLVQRSIARFTASGNAGRKALMVSVFRRLALVSVVAFAIAYLYRPVGWVVLVGLALFQMLMLGTVFGRLFQEVRRV